MHIETRISVISIANLMCSRFCYQSKDNINRHGSRRIFTVFVYYISNVCKHRYLTVNVPFVKS